jgi:hypothetical protein
MSMSNVDEARLSIPLHFFILKIRQDINILILNITMGSHIFYFFNHR